MCSHQEISSFALAPVAKKQENISAIVPISPVNFFIFQSFTVKFRYSDAARSIIETFLVLHPPHQQLCPLQTLFRHPAPNLLRNLEHRHPSTGWDLSSRQIGNQSLLAALLMLFE